MDLQAKVRNLILLTNNISSAELKSQFMIELVDILSVISYKEGLYANSSNKESVQSTLEKNKNLIASMASKIKENEGAHVADNDDKNNVVDIKSKKSKEKMKHVPRPKVAAHERFGVSLEEYNRDRCPVEKDIEFNLNNNPSRGKKQVSNSSDKEELLHRSAVNRNYWNSEGLKYGIQDAWKKTIPEIRDEISKIKLNKVNSSRFTSKYHEKNEEAKAKSENYTKQAFIKASLDYTNSFIEKLGINDESTKKLLLKMSEAACSIKAVESTKGDFSRGIPKTVSHLNYKLDIKSSTVVPLIFENLKTGKEFIKAPPVITNLLDPLLLTWINYEMKLLGINETKEITIKEMAEKESNFFHENKNFKKTFKTWTEDRSLESIKKAGVPLIYAETARSILEQNNSVVEMLSSKVIKNAPASFIDKNGDYTNEFKSFLRYMDENEHKIARIERFAIARLLMIPLNKLENELFYIAYPTSPEATDPTIRFIGKQKLAKKA